MLQVIAVKTKIAVLNYVRNYKTNHLSAKKHKFAKAFVRVEILSSGMLKVSCRFLS